MTLLPRTEIFLPNLGMMANRGSLDRPVAKVCALPRFSAVALNAEAVGRTLSFNSFTTNASLREPEHPGLTSAQAVGGNRKQYSESNKNQGRYFKFFWMVTSGVVIDSTAVVFKASMEEQKRYAPQNLYQAERMRRVDSFFEAIAHLYKKLRRLPNHPIQNFYESTA